MITDTTLYTLANKHDTLEESPSGRLLLDDEPLLAGDEIALRVDLGREYYYCPCWVDRDGAGWYAQSQADPTDVWPLRNGMRAHRLRAQ